MKYKFVRVVAALFSGFSLFSSSSLAAKITPYQSLVWATAHNFCAAEYGLLSDKESYDLIIEMVAEEHNFKPYQVYNLMQRSTFSKDTNRVVANLGGCKKIVAGIQKRIDSKSSGISGFLNNKKDYEYIYDLDAQIN